MKFERRKKEKTHLQRRVVVVAPSPVPSRRGALAREFLDQGRVVAEGSVVSKGFRERKRVVSGWEYETEEKGMQGRRPGRHRFFFPSLVADSLSIIIPLPIPALFFVRFSSLLCFPFSLSLSGYLFTHYS